MNTYRNTRRYIPVFVLAVLILVSLACGETAPTSEPRVSTTTPETVETQAPSEQPTNTSLPTNTPRSTNTPEPAGTPTPTSAPEPTQEVSELSFFEIREEFEKCTEGQAWGPIEEWDTYRDSVIGKRVQWLGWFQVVVDERSHYRVVVYMDSPDESDGYVNLILSYDPREKLEWHQEVCFQGTISDITTAYTVFDSVDLTDVTFVE